VKGKEKSAQKTTKERFFNNQPIRPQDWGIRNTKVVKLNKKQCVFCILKE
jgi:hypothetical protein